MHFAQVNVIVLKRLLGRLGMTSFAVPDGQAALNALQSRQALRGRTDEQALKESERPYSVVLMDLHMPGALHSVS